MCLTIMGVQKEKPFTCFMDERTLQNRTGASPNGIFENKVR